MNIAMGIDFGTTNSTICIYDGDDFYFAKFEGVGYTIPSLLYIDKDYSPTYGESARSLFLKDNLNRQVKLEKTDLGYIQLTMGDGAFESFGGSPFNPVSTTIDVKISALTDRNIPGFLFASTKRLLGQHSIGSVKLYDKDIKLEAIVSSILQNMLGETKAQFRTLEPVNVAVGRPVNYECRTEGRQTEFNSLAVSRMEKALEFAGVGTYEFLLEPIAPVLTHLHGKVDESNQNILVLDFGGGTLDFSLIRRRDRQLRVINNLGMALGGDIITEQLVRDYVFPRMGLTDKNLAELRQNHNYVAEMIPDILNWRTTYKLNQPKYFMQIASATKIIPDEAVKLNRIRLLIIQNYSYNVFYAVECAKKGLSNADATEIDLGAIGIKFTLTREDLETSLRPYLESVEGSINEFCNQSELDKNGIDRVVLTGGTSLIPCIGQMINRLFPGRVESIDPFLSIVQGFAIGAWLRGENRISDEMEGMRIDL